MFQEDDTLSSLDREREIGNRKQKDKSRDCGRLPSPSSRIEAAVCLLEKFELTPAIDHRAEQFSGAFGVIHR